MGIFIDRLAKYCLIVHVNVVVLKRLAENCSKFAFKKGLDDSNLKIGIGPVRKVQPSAVSGKSYRSGLYTKNWIFCDIVIMPVLIQDKIKRR